MTDNPAPAQLVTGLPGSGRNGRLIRLLTIRQRILRDVSRGGFPLLRKESCGR